MSEDIATIVASLSEYEIDLILPSKKMIGNVRLFDAASLRPLKKRGIYRRGEFPGQVVLTRKGKQVREFIALLRSPTP